MTFIISY